MKKIRLLFPALMMGLLVLSVQSCNQSATKENISKGVEHYRLLQFSETPFDTETGLHSLTPQQAENINNYRFTYNDQGQLISVEYCRGNELLTYGSLGGAARIVYTYDNNRQVKSYYNKEGEQIESGGVYTAEYTLDENGTRTSLRFLDKDGNNIENRNDIHRYTWNQLDNGLIRELRYNLNDEETIMNPFCPFYELRFEYDEKGYVTMMSNFQADTLYNCTAENCGDIGVAYFKFANSDKGDLLSFSVHNTTGQLSNLYWGWAKRVNKVDENGYVTETTLFDQDDEYLSGNNAPVTRYRYDEHGALIEATTLDIDGNIINNPGSGVAVTEYIYDDKGNRTETLRFDRNRVAVANQ